MLIFIIFEESILDVKTNVKIDKKMLDDIYLLNYRQFKFMLNEIGITYDNNIKQ